MFKQNSFPSKFLTEIEKDGRNHSEVSDWSATHTYRAITDWLGEQSRDTAVGDDMKIVQHVCAAISERCAILASVCVAELCNRNVKVSEGQQGHWTVLRNIII